MRESVDDADFQIGGKTFVAVLAEVGKLEGLAILGGKNFGGPQRFVETFDAAVESVVIVVLGKRVGFAVEDELSMADAVSVAANERSEIALVGSIAAGVVVAEEDIGELAVAVRHFQRDDRAAIVGDGGFRAAFRGKHIKIDRPAVGSFAERYFHGGTELWRCAEGRESGHKQGSQQNGTFPPSRHVLPI